MAKQQSTARVIAICILLLGVVASWGVALVFGAAGVVLVLNGTVCLCTALILLALPPN